LLSHSDVAVRRGGSLFVKVYYVPNAIALKCLIFIFLLGTLLEKTTLQIAVSLRLGISICQPHICTCGSLVDTLSHHGLSCIKSAGRISRHSCLNDILKRVFSSANIPCILEPTGVLRDDGKCPDGITIIPWKKGKSLVWDVTCTDTLALSHLSESSI
jgi:hypothetical protein